MGDRKREEESKREREEEVVDVYIESTFGLL
jgi:hypothetical protein